MKEMDDLEIKKGSAPAPVEATAGDEREGKKKREHLLLRLIREFLRVVLRKQKAEEVTDEEIQSELTRRGIHDREKNEQNRPFDLLLKAQQVANELVEKEQNTPHASRTEEDKKNQLDAKIDQLTYEGFVKDGRIWANQETLKRIIALKIMNDSFQKPQTAESEEEKFARIERLSTEALKNGLPLEDAEFFVMYRALQQKIGEERKKQGNNNLTQKKMEEILFSDDLKNRVQTGFQTVSQRFYGSEQAIADALRQIHKKEPTREEIIEGMIYGISKEDQEQGIRNLFEEKRANMEQTPSAKQEEDDEAEQEPQYPRPAYPTENEVKQRLEIELGEEPTREQIIETRHEQILLDTIAWRRGYPNFTEAPEWAQDSIKAEAAGSPVRTMAGGSGVGGESREANPGANPVSDPDRYRPPAEREERRGQINDIDDLVQRMGDISPRWQWEDGTRKWSKGEFPLKNEDGSINQANFMRWIRERMMYAHSSDPDAIIDFMNKIGVQRGWSQASMSEVTGKIDKYFRQEVFLPDGTKKTFLYHELAQQVIREIWHFNSSRNWDVEYRAVMGQEEDLPKTILKLFYTSTFTKTSWDHSNFYWVFTLPQYYDAHRREAGQSVPDDESKLTDVNVGSAIRASLLAYYYLSDFKELRERLGSNAALFNEDAFIETLRAENKKRKLEVEENPSAGERYKGLTREDIKNLRDIFNQGGKDGAEGFSQGAFTRFVNVFNSPEKENKTVSLVRGLIRKSVGERYGLYLMETDSEGKVIIGPDGRPQFKVDENGNKIMDDQNLNYAENFAFSMTRWLGIGARNDTGASAFDALSKVLNTRPYREKQFSDTRGGGFGNMFTVKAIRSLAVPFLHGVRTETVKGRNSVDGSNSYKTPLEILEDLDQAERDRIAAQGVQADTKDEVVNKTKELSKLVFPDNTMRSYALNHLNNSYKIFYNLMSGEELQIAKFVNFDVYGRLTFEETKFSETVKEKFLKPMRYAYATYDQLDFTNTTRRISRVERNGTVHWEEVSLAESLFGREVLDIPKFWKKEYAKNPDGSIKKVKKVMYGKEVDVPVVLKVHKGVIDPEEIQANKAQLWKQLALTRLAGELYSHRTRKGNYERHYMDTIEKIYRALEQIPGDIGNVGDNDLTQIRTIGRFFDDEDLKWLRKKSKTEFGRMFAEEMGFALFSGSWAGMKDAWQELYKYVTK